MTNANAPAGMLPVSTILLTKNNAASIDPYLVSMRSVDDIVVLDGGSTDSTLEKLRALPNIRVFPQPREFLDAQGYIVDFSGVRNTGYALARHRWILCVDADEEATPELLAEVRRVIGENRPGVFFARRTFYWRGRPVVGFSKSSSDQLRLFSLDVVRGCARPVHEKLDVLPGARRGMLDVDVSVPLPEASAVRRKYDRYLAIEVRANRGISVGRWARWILVRNLIAIVRRVAVHVASHAIPKRGPRYPWSLDCEQVRYAWLLIWRCCPLRRARPAEPLR